MNDCWHYYITKLCQIYILIQQYGQLFIQYLNLKYKELMLQIRKPVILGSKIDTAVHLTLIISRHSIKKIKSLLYNFYLKYPRPFFISSSQHLSLDKYIIYFMKY